MSTYLSYVRECEEKKQRNQKQDGGGGTSCHFLTLESEEEWFLLRSGGFVGLFIGYNIRISGIKHVV